MHESVFSRVTRGDIWRTCACYSYV